MQRQARGFFLTRTAAIRRLERAVAAAPMVHIGRNGRLVVFSDLHMGDGGPRDEFIPNARLFSTVLAGYYLKRGFQLVLNGDIEDLYRFSLVPIMESHEGLYRLFDEFHRGTALYKIAGNHDLELLNGETSFRRYQVLPALRLQIGEHSVLLLHGHQADVLTPHFGRLFGFLSRHIISPLGFRNQSVAHDEMKKYRTEKRIYDFAKSRGIMAVIGHTHRPLFESLSRIDCLKFQIEALCRSYPQAGADEQPGMVRKVRTYQQELQRTLEKDLRHGSRSSLYDSGRLVPCLFNSGCAIGKRGITALEIADGRVALVFWFDQARATKYFDSNGYRPEQLGETGYFRVPLKEDGLDYLFARIRLLA